MRKYIMELVIGLFLLGLAGLAGATPIQWASSAGGNDHWYDYISSPYESWTQAEIAAKTSSLNGSFGYLATITSAAENSFIFSYIAGTGNPTWLGGFQDPLADSEPAGEWQWVTGEAWGYTNWDPATSEPNNGGPGGGEEDSLVFRGGGLWNDAPTDYIYYDNGGYVVEYEPIPEPATMLLLGTGLIGVAGAARRRKKNQA